MKEMTATEVARSFSAVLDAVERGESIVVTRGGERLATIAPAPRANGAAINEIIRKHAVPLAEGEADPMLEVLEELRALTADVDGDPWRD